MNREAMTRVKNKLILLALTIISTLFGLSWAISSPPGSAADEIYHLGSIWCAWGENKICKFDGEPQENGRRNITLTTEFSKAGCFRSDIDKKSKSAKCYSESINNNDRFAWEMNSGNYPGLTYTVLRTFASNNLDLSVIIMRIFNYSLLTFSIIFAFYALRPMTFYASMLAIFITLIPVSVFFLTSINPNSWTIIGIGLYWAYLWDLFSSEKHTSSRLIYIGLILTSILSIGSRSDASIYIILLNLIAFVYVIITKRMAKDSRYLIITLLISIWAAIQFIYNQQFEAESKKTNTEGGLSLLWQNLIDLPVYYLGIFGGKGPEEWPFGLGWFDTPIPSLVSILGVLNLVVVISFLTKLKGKKQKLFIALLPIFMISIPLVILQLRGTGTIFFLQPRYLLPLLIVFLGILMTNFAGAKYLNVTIAIIIFNLSISNSISLYTNIKRYTVGLNSKASIFDSPEWWWNIPLTPSLNWVIGSITFPILMAILFFGLFNKNEQKIIR